MASTKQVTIETGERDEKKRVVKFDLTDEKAGISGAVYVDNATDKRLGSPTALSVTFETLK